MIKLPRPLLLALLGGVTFAACDSSDSAPPPPLDYGIEIVSFDGKSSNVTLKCENRLTLAVGVKVTPKDEFKLRPLGACGENARCGYVNIAGLNESGETLAEVDTFTVEGVLELAPIDALTALVAFRARLMRGVDGQPVLTPKGDIVEHVLTPEITLPEADCSTPSGGAGGAPNGGAGGTEPAPGGMGGQALEAGAGGAGGAPNGGAGGAGAGGAEPSLGSAGAPGSAGGEGT